METNDKTNAAAAAENNTNSDDAMRLAFEQFMMSGRGGPNNNSNNYESITTASTKHELMTQNRFNQQMYANIKRYWQIFRNFANTVQKEWLDLDDEAYRVIQAVSEVRNRLSMEAGLELKFQDAMIQKHPWARHGHAFNFSQINIQRQDVELALSHDLEQHEKMMVGLRSLFSKWSECHESLMRQTDVMMMHHFDCRKDDYHDVTFSTTSLENAASLTEVMTNMLKMLSLELYRKQSLVQMILETANDNLVIQDEDKRRWRKRHYHHENESWEDLSPVELAKRCCRQWPRTSQYGCIDSKDLTSMLELLN